MKVDTNITPIIITYLSHFPAEASRVKTFTDFLSRTTPEDLFSRKNFDGHITTSAFIINRHTKEMLLLRHKSLNRWLQPGGHFEDDASLLLSALREANEETGISSADLQHKPIDADPLVPFDIDSHYIPANPKKLEEGHYHHDFRYLFCYTGYGQNNYNPDESTGMKWVPFNELANDDTFGFIVKKIEAVI